MPRHEIHLVYVAWMDAAESCAGEAAGVSIDEFVPVVFQTYGCLIDEDDTWIHVGYNRQSSGPFYSPQQGEWDRITHIPKVLVLKRHDHRVKIEMKGEVDESD